MHIRQLAQAAQVTVDALRHYEKVGLLPPPERADNGYRRYGAQDVLRVQVIRLAQGLGFGLSEVKDLLPDLAEGKLGVQLVRDRLIAKRNQLDAELARLQALRDQVDAALSQLNCAPDTPVRVASTARALPVRQRTRMPGAAPGQGFST